MTKISGPSGTPGIAPLDSNFTTTEFTVRGVKVIVTDTIAENTAPTSPIQYTPERYRVRKDRLLNLPSLMDSAIGVLQDDGFTVPNEIKMNFGFRPGSGSDQRSNAAYWDQTINLDLEEVLGLPTIVHELVHLSTPRLCAAGTLGTFFREGLAQRIEEIHSLDGHAAPTRNMIEITGDEFYSSPGDIQTRRETACYDLGYHLVTEIEKKSGGMATVMRIVSELEKEPSLSPPTPDDSKRLEAKLEELIYSYTWNDATEWMGDARESRVRPEEIRFAQQREATFFGATQGLLIGASFGLSVPSLFKPVENYLRVEYSGGDQRLTFGLDYENLFPALRSFHFSFPSKENDRIGTIDVGRFFIGAGIAGQATLGDGFSVVPTATLGINAIEFTEDNSPVFFFGAQTLVTLKVTPKVTPNTADLVLSGGMRF